MVAGRRAARVLLVATEVDPAGTEGGATHIRELLHHFRARGPTLLLARRGASGPDIRGVGEALSAFPPPSPHAWALRTLPRALVHAAMFRPDVIYERCTSFGLGALLGAALRRPLVTKVLDQRVSPLSLRFARRLVATDVRLIARAYRDKAIRVAWGVDADRFAPRARDVARRKLGLAADVPLLTYVGSFKRWHDLLTLVRAVDAMQCRAARVALVGDGPLRRPVIGLARRRGIRDRFILPGTVAYDHVPDWLAAADVCVAPFDPSGHPPSRRLGFSLDPLKVLESMSMAKPTITIDAPNVRRLATPEEHAILVPSRDPSALALAIDRVLANPVEAQRLGANARARVQAQFTWARHVQHLETIFAELRSP